jgi:hypothetical protein
LVCPSNYKREVGLKELVESKEIRRIISESKSLFSLFGYRGFVQYLTGMKIYLR